MSTDSAAETHINKTSKALTEVDSKHKNHCTASFTIESFILYHLIAPDSSAATQTQIMQSDNDTLTY